MISLDRFYLKKAAKEKIASRALGITGVTVVYLALTDWLQTAANLVLENPLSTLLNRYSDLLGDAAADVSASLSSADQNLIITSLLQTARDLLSKPLNQVTLFFFLLLYLFSIVIGFGYSDCAMSVLRDNAVSWRNLFDRFYLAGRVIILHLITIAVSALGMTFFILPGVWFYYGVQQAPYLLLDNPELSVFRALRQSMRISRGNKMSLFVLDLSFIGWVFAASIASEIGLALGSFCGSLMGGDVVATIFSTAGYALVAVFLIPYMELTRVGFYEALRAGQGSEGSLERN